MDPGNLTIVWPWGQKLLCIVAVTDRRWALLFTKLQHSLSKIQGKTTVIDWRCRRCLLNRQRFLAPCPWRTRCLWWTCGKLWDRLRCRRSKPWPFRRWSCRHKISNGAKLDQAEMGLVWVWITRGQQPGRSNTSFFKHLKFKRHRYINWISVRRMF